MKIADLSSILKPRLTAREVRAWSFIAAIRAADSRLKESNFEAEVSATYSKLFGWSDGGILVPPQILFGSEEQLRRLASRAMAASPPSAGGFAIGEEVTPLFAYLFPRSKVARLGAQIMPSLLGADAGGQVQATGNVTLPVETSSNEGEWLGESQTSTANHNSAFGAAVASPKRVYAERTISNQLLAQGAGADEYVKRIVMASYAAAIDRAALVGTGGVQPVGVLSQSGVNDVSHGTNGGAPTGALLTTAEKYVIGNNAPMENAGYIVSSNVRAKLKNIPFFSNTSRGLLETINGQDYVNGYPAFATKFLPDDGTKASGSSLGSFIFGDWGFTLIALWAMLQIESDRVTQARSGKTIVFCNAFMDTLHPRPEVFSRATDIVTT